VADKTLESTGTPLKASVPGRKSCGHERLDASCSASGHKALEALLSRKDVWRGSSQAFVAHKGVDTGFDELNASLLHKGWPEGCLVECGQAGFAANWFLMSHACKTILKERGGLMAVLNPPAMPYAQSLLQMGIPTQCMVVINTVSKSDFVACFIELSRSDACQVLMAWQPKQKLSYTELRKCQLATSERSGVYCLFRHSLAFTQSSPASLRIDTNIREQSLHLEIVKQRGRLPGHKLELDLPSSWFTECDYVDLSEFNEREEVLYREQASLYKASPKEKHRNTSQVLSFNQRITHR
jgi:protein ImuA